MTQPQAKKISEEVAMFQDGKEPRSEKPEARYCASCGADANLHGSALERFGEAFCSEGHAQEFVEKVRAARVQTAAGALNIHAAPAESPPHPPSAEPARGPQNWKRYLKMGACCATPILALAFLAGGGKVLLGAAGAVLPLAAALACPLGMYFMTRAMMKMGQEEHRHDKGEEK
jgi:hypothetical protein